MADIEPQTKNAGLMPISGEASTMCKVFAAGLRAVLERYWPGSMPGLSDFTRRRSGLGLGFLRNFCVPPSYNLAPPK